MMLFNILFLWLISGANAMQSNQPKRLLVAGGFLIKDNKVLLAFRQNSSGDNGSYGLIGGKVEMGEPIHTALIREIYEEIGVIVKPEDMQLIHVISFHRENGDEIISCDFIIKAWEGEPINKEVEKHAHIAWFDLDNLPVTILPRHKDAYELYRKGVYYSAAGW